MIRTLRSAPRGKFTADLWWNAAAFGCSAVVGVLINLVIVRSYDADALGVFNQTYACTSCSASSRSVGCIWPCRPLCRASCMPTGARMRM
jgi:hypothetical protein